jgi:hypothetical protein
MVLEPTVEVMVEPSVMMVDTIGTVEMAEETRPPGTTL